jgi:phosphoglucosamine mutase
MTRPILRIGRRPPAKPGIAYLTKNLGRDLGIAITASHSSYNENGFKLFELEGLKLPRETEIEIEESAEALLRGQGCSVLTA